MIASFSIKICKLRPKNKEIRREKEAIILENNI